MHSRLNAVSGRIFSGRKTNEFESCNLRPELFGPVFRTENITLQQAMDNHATNRRTRLLATLVPDEVVYTIDLMKKDFKKFVGVLLYANISGFTTLCKKYINTGNGGTFGLTTTLNAYIGAMVQEIYAYGGDVFKFSGDALLALWKVRKDEFIFNTIHEVITCALCIQRTLGCYKTDVNVVLKVKLAISAGNVTFSVIGDDRGRQYVMAGIPINEVKLAERTCVTGDLVLAASAWGHCTPCNYEYVIKDMNNIKVSRIIENPTKHQERVRIPFISYSLIEQIGEHKISNTDEAIAIQAANEGSDYVFAGRFSVTEASRRKLGKQLRTFLVKPVVEQIDMDVALEHLTEFKRVTMVHVNVAPTRTTVYELISIVDEAFIVLYGIVSDYMGCVNKVSLFSNDITFLATFGLRGFETGSDCRNGLYCAYQILNTLKRIGGVESVSVGVTTGMVYCGVIGHPLRREYSIIGAPVDIATRIMITYPDKVACEFDTILHSNLPRSSFALQQPRDESKSSSYPIFEYIKNSPQTEGGNVTELAYPMLGRSPELELLSDLLDEIGVSGRSHTGLVIEGENRIGKSRLLDGFVAMIRAREIVPIITSLSSSQTGKSHSAIHHILLQILELEEHCSPWRREEALIRKLKDIVPAQDLCYLNVLMRVRFRMTKRYFSETEWERQMKTTNIFENILRMSSTKRCIVIDDAHHLDPMSWQFLSHSMDNNNIFVVMSILVPDLKSIPPKVVNDIYVDSRMARCTITGLESDLLAPLACQLLNVQAIPMLLAQKLIERCHYNPGWCEAYMTLILQNGGFVFADIFPRNTWKYKLVFPPAQLITRKPLNMSLYEMTPLPWNHMDKVNVCLLNSKFYAIGDESHTSIRDIMLETYMRLTPYEQCLLNCAATLGTVFTRYMMETIMPDTTPLFTTRAVANLMNLRILGCATVRSPNTGLPLGEGMNFSVIRKSKTLSDTKHLIHCHCRNVAPPAHSALVPLYANCKFLEFKIPAFQQLIYKQIPPSKKIDFHIKAIDIYELSAHKCRPCGRGRFLKLPMRKESVERSSDKVHNSIKLERQSVSETPSKKKRMRRRSILSVSCIGTDVIRDRDRDIPHEADPRKVSILPTHSELNYESDDTYGGFENSTGTIKMNHSCPIEKSCASTDVCVWEGKDAVQGINKWIKFVRTKPSAIKPQARQDASRVSGLKNFNEFIDLRNCQCNTVVGFIYKEILYHSENTGNIEKQIRFLIEFGAGLIFTAQFPHAIKLLNMADEKNEAVPVDSKDLNYEDRVSNKSIILSLIGDAYAQLGYFDKARRYFLDAISVYGYTFCTAKLYVCKESVVHKWRQWTHQRFPGVFIGQISGHNAVERLKIASNIGQLALIFMREEQWKLTKLAALKSVNMNQQCISDLSDQCQSYITAMSVYRRLGDLDFCRRLEESAERTTEYQCNWTDVHEVLAVVELYSSMFLSKLLRGELGSAIVVAFKALQISERLHINKIKFAILPMLIQVMIETKRIHEAVDLMGELLFLAEEDVDASTTTWYYALCLDLQLDAGLTLESYKICQEYAQTLFVGSESEVTVVRDLDSSKRLLTSMWLWNLRMGIVSETAKYEQLLECYIGDLRHDNYSHVVTVAKALECHILTITRCINHRRASSLPEVHDGLRSLVNRLSEISRTAKFIKPRLYLLKSYLNMVRGRKAASVKDLSHAEKFAELQGNKLIMAWIKRNKKIWQGKYNSFEQYWVDNTEHGKSVDWHDVHALSIKDWAEILYPLPIPDTSL